MTSAPLQATSAPTGNLTGLVKRVTFHNQGYVFCILRLRASRQRDLVTVVGHAAMISAGEWVQAAGTWINDRMHGLQFRASFLKATAPTTLNGIGKSLGSGMICGTGLPGKHHAPLRPQARAVRPPRFEATRCAADRKGACCAMPEDPGTT